MEKKQIKIRDVFSGEIKPNSLFTMAVLPFDETLSRPDFNHKIKFLIVVADNKEEAKNALSPEMCLVGFQDLELILSLAAEVSEKEDREFYARHC